MSVFSLNKKPNSNAGFLSLGLLIFILIFLISVYSSFKIIPFYYSYYELQNLFDAQADVASNNKDSEIIDTIDRTIKKLEIPAEIKDVKLRRDNGKIFIELSYSEVFYIDFGGGYDYDIWEFHFHPKTERRI